MHAERKVDMFSHWTDCKALALVSVGFKLVMESFLKPKGHENPEPSSPQTASKNGFMRSLQGNSNPKAQSSKKKARTPERYSKRAHKRLWLLNLCRQGLLVYVSHA